MTVFVVTATFCTIVILFGGVGVWITQDAGFGNSVLIIQIIRRAGNFYSFLL